VLCSGAPANCSVRCAEAQLPRYSTEPWSLCSNVRRSSGVSLVKRTSRFVPADLERVVEEVIGAWPSGVAESEAG